MRSERVEQYFVRTRFGLRAIPAERFLVVVDKWSCHQCWAVIHCHSLSLKMKDFEFAPRFREVHSSLESFLIILITSRLIGKSR